MAKKLTQNVNKDKIFNDLPKVVPEFSKWLSRKANYQACNIGDIVPVYYDEVLPNEKRKVTMSMISHTTTPMAPIFNSLYTELRAFFVPMRLAADLLNGYKTRKSPWVKVFGEDNANASSQVIVPLANQALPSFTTSHRFISDLGTYFGSAPTDNVFDSLDCKIYGNTASKLAKMNYLNVAAYELIYQRHYRNENYEASTSSKLYQLLFDAYNSSKASVTLGSSFAFEKSNREKDYFTGMKPFTQKGDPMNVSIGGTAPIIGMDGTTKRIDKMQFQTAEDQGDIITRLWAFKGSTGQAYIQAVNDGAAYASNTGMGEHYSDLVADLSSAQGISIEELRLLIKTQELLEKDAIYGSLYAESLNAHFGCCPLDLTLQDPQEIYKTTITSQMQAIFQTSQTSGQASILGTIGANSTTQTDPFVIMPETKFKEHGIVMICAVHKLQNVYDSTYYKPKFIFKNGRFDFYTPELDALGYQSVTNNEMQKSSNATAGFNEAFAEYRYKFNQAHGSIGVSFSYWCPPISDEYTSAAALYKEDPQILDKSLSEVHSTVPQFYDAWGFEDEVTKPMSLHSIPGFDGVI